ncbi:MAG: hypothetical protein EXR29_15665 [Betaproteobacteria bacterium]|nr:hypothetical protein [Betaproteobacteria bacterium]
MKGLPEELIYGLIFAVIVLFQYLMKRFGPQPQPQSPQDAPDAEFPEQEQAAPELSTLSAASDIQFGRSRAPGASAALPERRFSRRALMGNRQEVRNAIVIATILGPCRAYEPHDIR